MGIKVVKFGGSSLSDAQQFRKVRDIVLSDSSRKYVVPSAPGKRSYTDEKVTDLLYLCAEKAEKGGQFRDVFDRISERYIDIAFELELKFDILSELETARENIANGAGADYAASRGEYLNGLLLADYLGFKFIDPASIIKFDENGVFDSEITNTLASKMLSDNPNSVIPGFYGSMPDGSIKTFSRGGSDISGAIVARAINAEVYENWTDVSGLLMADPRVVHNPKPIRYVTYEELRELSYMGASVLHDEAIFPVRQAKIPINVRNTNSPSDAGSMIVSEVIESDDAITGIAGKCGFSVISLAKDKMNSEIGFAAKVLGVLARHNISLEHMPTGIDTLSIIVSDACISGKVEQVLFDLKREAKPDKVEFHDKISMLAIVGHNMAGRIGTSAKIFSALADSNINIKMIDQGSSEMNIIIGVDSDSLNDAVNAIYRRVVENE